jgi:hypothetical protein
MSVWLLSWLMSPFMLRFWRQFYPINNCFRRVKSANSQPRLLGLEDSDCGHPCKHKFVLARYVSRTRAPRYSQWFIFWGYDLVYESYLTLFEAVSASEHANFTSLGICDTCQMSPHQAVCDLHRSLSSRTRYSKGSRLHKMSRDAMKGVERLSTYSWNINYNCRTR